MLGYNCSFQLYRETVNIAKDQDSYSILSAQQRSCEVYKYSVAPIGTETFDLNNENNYNFSRELTD